MTTIDVDDYKMLSEASRDALDAWWAAHGLTFVLSIDVGPSIVVTMLDLDDAERPRVIPGTEDVATRTAMADGAPRFPESVRVEVAKRQLRADFDRAAGALADHVRVNITNEIGDPMFYPASNTPMSIRVSVPDARH